MLKSKHKFALHRPHDEPTVFPFFPPETYPQILPIYEHLTEASRHKYSGISKKSVIPDFGVRGNR